MSATLRKIALVGGSGRLGPYLLKALQANPSFDVTVVSRQNSTATFPPNTKLVKIADDYPKNEILEAFRGQDAVILSLNWMTESQHHDIFVDASIEAGVKRLIPSIWGGRLDLPGARDVFPFTATKHRILEYTKSKLSSNPNWSYTAVATGLFHDLCAQTGFYGIDPVAHSAKIWGDGNTKFSATTRDTVSLAVTNILENPAETKNKMVYISSFEISLNDLLAAYKQATGVSEWSIDYGNIDEGIEEAKHTSATSEDMMKKMRAVSRLGLLVGLKEELGADFVAAGLSDNELLGVPRGDLEQTIASSLSK